MQFQTKTSSTLRSFIPRGTQIGFIVGLLLGILLGWLFNGVVGAVMRLGFVAVAMLILLAALFFWFNVRRGPQREGLTVYTWSSTSLQRSRDEQFRDANIPREDRRDQDVIDLQELKDQMRREREP